MAPYRLKQALSRRTAAVGVRGDGVRAISLRIAALSRHSSRIAYQLHSACLPAAVRIAARARLDRISEEVRELTCMLSVQ